jgi:hypothetical protein
MIGLFSTEHEKLATIYYGLAHPPRMIQVPLLKKPRRKNRLMRTHQGSNGAQNMRRSCHLAAFSI